MVSNDHFVFFFNLFISYILYCVFDHVNTTAGCFQVIICLVLSFLCLIKVVVDLSHVNVFGPVPATKRDIENTCLEYNDNKKLDFSYHW